MNSENGVGIRARALVVAVIAFLSMGPARGAAAPKNFFANPSFELGRNAWTLSRDRGTDCRFSVDDGSAADGRYSALIAIRSVKGWGTQFGQSFPAGAKGKTYTFAVVAKSLDKPVRAALQIERGARPWDRAARSDSFRLVDKWREYHVTFTVEKDFPQGWFAYISCTQPNARFRVDMFRLYEGDYVPYRDIQRQQENMVGVRLLDTVTAGRGPLSAKEWADHPGWRRIPEDETVHAFRGNAVLMNDRLACVLRRGAAGVEVYALKPAPPKLCAVLGPGGGNPSLAVASWKIVHHAPDAGELDVSFAGAGATAVLRCELDMGQVFVQTRAMGGVKSLRLGAPCRFAVMPDFFADDIVIDATELPVASADVPADNIFMHLLPDHRAIVVAVAKNAENDVRIALQGKKGARRIAYSDIPYGKDKTVWIAVMSAPDIWHMHDVRPEQAGTIVPLGWKAPFPAQWRVDWRRRDGLHDSWEMLNEKADGSYAKYKVFGGPGMIPASRKRWTTVLGTFRYPCWLDRGWNGYFQPIRHSALHFQGPAVIYPINRVRETSLDTFTVVDIVRGTLGVGPCEYVLDIEGQQSQYRGRATCAVRDTLNPIYAAGKQKQKRAQIETVLDDLMLFVRHIRGRIERYVAFGHETLAYLAEQKKAHPELSRPISELEALTRVIDAKVAARRAKIATPAKVAETVEEFRKTVLDYDGKDALARCKRFTNAWVGVGGNQDELAGECRWAVKVLRQRAALLVAEDPRMAPIAKEIRRRSRNVLRNPAIHEGAGH